MKNCIDCNKRCELRTRSIRCKICQKIFRKKCKKLNRKKNSYKHRNKWITKLGGLPITLEEIRNYKGGLGRNPPKCNEAEWMIGAKTYYTEEEYYNYGED